SESGPLPGRYMSAAAESSAEPAQLAAAGRRVFQVEAQALEAVGQRVGEDFARACRLILASRWRLVCTGMGKSGHVARKIAATLASTGTLACITNLDEVGEGDLSMITDADIVLALYYSGESDEVLLLLPAMQRQGNKVIAMTGRAQSTLAR